MGVAPCFSARRVTSFDFIFVIVPKRCIRFKETKSKVRRSSKNGRKSLLRAKQHHGVLASSRNLQALASPHFDLFRFLNVCSTLRPQLSALPITPGPQIQIVGDRSRESRPAGDLHHRWDFRNADGCLHVAGRSFLHTLVCGYTELIIVIAAKCVEFACR